MSCQNTNEEKRKKLANIENIKEIVKKCKKISKKPIYVKLSPNITNISKVAKAVEYAGADAIIAINTVLAFSIDSKSWKKIFPRFFGCYSGTGIFPIALRFIYEIYIKVQKYQ